MNTPKPSQTIWGMALNASTRLILPLLLAFTTYHCLPEKTDIPQQASALASIAATLLGFIIAAVAIIVSIDDQTLIKNLKHYGYYNNLITSMMYSGLFMLITTLFSLSVGFLTTSIQSIGIAIAIYAATLAFVFFIEASRKLWLVMLTLAKHQ